VYNIFSPLLIFKIICTLSTLRLHQNVDLLKAVIFWYPFFTNSYI